MAEKLAGDGFPVAYSTLTAFCRRYEVGVRPKKRSGHYHFGPGEEMQHDTSPHTVEVGGRRRVVQCASLVMCYSRMIFAQVYARWSRFECKVLLTEALCTFGGAAARCMLDNSTVIMTGTGANAVPVDEMAAFSDRFGFTFVAHKVGDANRSARVERPFHYIENNFYVGRTFASLSDLNAQLATWCDERNRTYKARLEAKPIERFADEKPLLVPLPIHVPEVYDLHIRRVDVDGYVCLHTNRYSVPASLIGRRVEVRESIERIRVFDGHRLVVEHERVDSGARQRLTLPEHRHPSRRRNSRRLPVPEAAVLRSVSPELSSMVDALNRQYGGQAGRYIRQLHRLFLDYPTESLIKAVKAALHYKLLDLNRIERMVLKNIAGDFFRLPILLNDDEEE